MKAIAPQILTWTAAEATVKYLRLHEGTDRHQLHVGFAAAGNAFAVSVACPQKDAQGTLPEPAAVPPADWVTLAFAPANSDRLVLTLVGRYVRFTPNGAGPGQVVKVAYQPLPPTSP